MELQMNHAGPSFGILSGFCTSVGLAPHILALAFFLVIGNSPPLNFLLMFTVGAKLLAEWFFWTKSAERLNEKNILRTRRVVPNQELLSHPNFWIPALMIFVDAISEISLISLALKTALSPALILFTFLGCQALSSPIQGAMSDYFSRKNSLLFTLIVSMLILATTGSVLLDEAHNNSPLFYLINALYLLSPLTPDSQMIVMLCLKGLLGNLTVISRAAMAELIKIKSFEKAP